MFFANTLQTIVPNSYIFDTTEKLMPNTLSLYVGTYTQSSPQGEGIHLFQFDPSSGALSAGKVVAETVNPSYLALDPTGRFLYAVNETGSASNLSGGVSAYAIDPASGALRLLNQRMSLGADPCYLQVDGTGRALVVANYTSGSVISFPLNPDGSLGEHASFFQHVGASVNPRRQEAAHAHMARIEPNGRFVFVPDLGIDQVKIYRLDSATAALQPNDPAAVSVEAGQGPRHFDFHPNRKFAYLINELGSTVTAFRYDEVKGTLETLQTLPTLPAGFTQSSCAHIQVHPSGKFLYGSNRGHDSLAIFQIDAESGLLTASGHASTQGRVPRNFTLDPSGTFLLAANQDSNTIVTFRVDQNSGALTPTGAVSECSRPVCLKFG